MKTTKLYKLLLLLPFFLSQPSLASDSLKVKKTEYYDNNILVREMFFDTLGRKTKDICYNFQDMYYESLSNEVLIIKYKNGKHFSFTTYFCKVKGDSVYFYNPTFMGFEQKVIIDTSGKVIESINTLFRFKNDNLRIYFSLHSLQDSILPKDTDEGSGAKYKYDVKGNKIERIGYLKNKISNKIYYKYDTLSRLIEEIYKEPPLKTLATRIYQGNNYTTNILKKEGLRVLEKKIEKVFENDNKQELRKEKYIATLKDFRIIGEPKLTFTQENIYENDRIVKIIYEDLNTGKKKIHELKYEFY